MGLDRNPVSRPQEMKVERGDDGHHRRRGRLVPADLGDIGIWPDVVGMVDHLRREPEHPTLDLGQSLRLGS
jgi:hypothetical protein